MQKMNKYKMSQVKWAEDIVIDKHIFGNDLDHDTKQNIVKFFNIYLRNQEKNNNNTTP